MYSSFVLSNNFAILQQHLENALGMNTADKDGYARFQQNPLTISQIPVEFPLFCAN